MKKSLLLVPRSPAQREVRLVPRSHGEVGNSFSKALQSLRLLVDPAAEGNPFEADKSYWSNKSDKPNRIFGFRRRFGLR